MWKPAGWKATESPTLTVSLDGKKALAIVASPSFFAVAAGGPTSMVFVLACATGRHEEEGGCAGKRHRPEGNHQWRSLKVC